MPIFTEQEQRAIDGLRLAHENITATAAQAEKLDRAERSMRTDALISDILGELHSLHEAGREALTIAEGVNEPIEIYNLRRQLDEARDFLARMEREGVS